MCLYFDLIKAALVSRRDFFQKQDNIWLLYISLCIVVDWVHSDLDRSLLSNVF